MTDSEPELVRDLRVGDVAVVREALLIDTIFHNHSGRVVQVADDFITLRVSVEILCKPEELELYDARRHGYP